MKTIYLVDYLGVHCGMHYYLDAFKKVLQDNNFDIKILSNYSDSINVSPFFYNQYKGNIIKKGISLLLNLYKLRKFIKLHNKDTIIYLTYGNTIDLPFMHIISKTPNHIIDIHEAIAQNIDSNIRLKNQFKQIYKNKIITVISHSSRTDDFLKEYRFNGKCFHVPHFKYVFPKEYNLLNIDPNIVNAVDSSRINLLFFGNLNENKGVDILIEAVNKLSDSDADLLNVIIAGKDFDGAVDRIKPLKNNNIKIFKRHISDDELRFLYQKVDYLALPYRKTSQSGILEMAFYFKRPIIASNIPYFQLTLKKFPSFGILDGNNSDSFSKTLSKVISSHSETQYFNDSDYSKYENRKEINDFLMDFNYWLQSNDLE